MNSLQQFFAENGSRDIHTIAQFIQQHVDAHWEQIFLDMRDEMIARYDEIGDQVYGLYGAELFRHVHDQLKLNGVRATPRLPGNFGNSREWGSEDDRQRWMWSKIITSEGTAVGTIVVVFYHDHLQIRVPRAFEIIGLKETAKGEVVQALSQRSPEFKNALEARIEYANYQ